MIRAALPLTAAVLALLVAPASAVPSAADRQWLGRCAAQLAKEHADRKAVRRYCACMHAIVADNAPLRQTEMERMYPPAHRACRKEAGW